MTDITLYHAISAYDNLITSPLVNTQADLQESVCSLFHCLLFSHILVLFLSLGDQAKNFFLQSGLPPPILAQIWSVMKPKGSSSLTLTDKRTVHPLLYSYSCFIKYIIVLLCFNNYLEYQLFQ